LPPEPQSASCEPTAQRSPTQHPAQFFAVQEELPTQVPPVHTWAAPQVPHCAPLAPHCMLVVPPTQTLSEQHPVQLSGPQGAEQTPPAPSPPMVALVQMSPLALQLSQAAPLPPQAVLSVPGRQTSPTQHPLQLAAEHAADPVHSPPVPASASPRVQSWPVAEQSTHSSPPLPQVGSTSPATQMLPTQHPVQLSGPHEVGLQAPASPSQELPLAVQSVHSAPPLPQAVGSVPRRQVPPSTPPQQPSQTPPLPQPPVPKTQVWLVPSQEVSLSSQFVHAAPSVPQVVSPMPRWQVPSESQQPVGQVDAEHGPLSPPASRAPPSLASVVASAPGAASGRPKSR
jgi:hypothetical protein